MAPAQVAAALGASIIDNPTPADYGGWSGQQQRHLLGGKNCPHGKMTAIQGTGKDGKTYRGYFCPAPKGAFDKCKECLCPCRFTRMEQHSSLNKLSNAYT
jgi:hypothetical protein